MSLTKLCPMCGQCPQLSRADFTSPETIYVNCINPFCPLYGQLFPQNEWDNRPIEGALSAKIDRAKDLLQEELGEWVSVSAVYLPDHYLQLRQVLDVLEGGGE